MVKIKKLLDKILMVLSNIAIKFKSSCCSCESECKTTPSTSSLPTIEGGKNLDIVEFSNQI